MSAKKGQRTISSFFASKSKPPVIRDEPCIILDDDTQEPEVKRPRLLNGISSPAPPTPATPSTPSQTWTLPPRSAERTQVARERLVTGWGESAGNVPPREATGNVPSTSAECTPSGRAGAIKYTPLEQQVVALKQKYPRVVLIVEVGYKMRFFGEDAELAAKLCNIYCHLDHNFMTASFPVPRIPVYVRRLVHAGYKVGVVRQSESAAIKSISANKSAPFERQLAGLYTPATLEAGLSTLKTGEEESAEVSPDVDQPLSSGVKETAACYLMCLAGAGPSGTEGTKQGDFDVPLGVIAVDTCGGDVMAGTCRSLSDLEGALLAVRPVEVVAPDNLSPAAANLVSTYISAAPGRRQESLKQFDMSEVPALLERITSHERAQPSWEGLDSSCRAALAVAVAYLEPFGLEGVLSLNGGFRPLASHGCMTLSANALCQLEILEAGGGGSVGSLLHHMDRCRTASGSRMLRNWLVRPSRHRETIVSRLDAVAELASGSGTGPASRIPALLSRLPDLQRGLSRIVHRTAPVSEFVATISALSQVYDKLHLPADAASRTAALEAVSSSLLRNLLDAATSPTVRESCRSLLAPLNARAAAKNDYPLALSDAREFGDVVAARVAVDEAEKHLHSLLPALSRTLGMPGLSYTTIQNQGSWLIEVPVEREGRVPQLWEKVCSTKKCNRYHPLEVKAGVLQLEVSKERLTATCVEAWKRYCSNFAPHYPALKAAVDALAHLDVLQALADVSRTPGHVRPELLPDEAQPQVFVDNLVHPMLHASLGSGAVPNSIHLGGGGVLGAVITGPNMGGKSCLVRALALAVIMAQVGCFVPASAARLHVHDAVFTRMGASDNLLAGRSTFMEELSGASEILAAATSRSLVIMDELGRGTATHDGVAIASAVLLHLTHTIRAPTLFVTHYPEVAALSNVHPDKLAAFHMGYIRHSETELTETLAVDALNSPQHLPSSTSTSSAPASVTAGGTKGPIQRITFLYALRPGAADQSFGINVAAMAGLPHSILQTATKRAGAMRAKVEGGAKQQEDLDKLGTAVNEALTLARSALACAEATQETVESGSVQLRKEHIEALSQLQKRLPFVN